MSVSCEFKAAGGDVQLRRRDFHGVERAEYSELARLSVPAAMALATELTLAIAAARDNAVNARTAALAEARKRLAAAQADVERLEREIAGVV